MNTYAPAVGFGTTIWEDVDLARGDGRDALNRLCSRYWTPLYAYLLRRGLGKEDAQDAVQGFLLYFLDRGLLESVHPSLGRFRRYLLACLDLWLSNERRTASRLIRGGDVLTFRMDFETADKLVGHLDCDPAEAYRRVWALEVMREAMFRTRSAIVAPRHFKARYRTEIKSVIRETVGPGVDVAEEIAELFRGLAQ